MEIPYVVLLKPSEIRFTSNYVKERFDNNIPLSETLIQLQNGEIFVDDIPFIKVIWSQERWEWYTLNNRRLWVFLQLERSGHCQFIKTRRIESMENGVFDPELLYGSARLQIKYESPSKKVKLLATTLNSQHKQKNSRIKRTRSFEYQEMRVSIENKIKYRNTSGFTTYQETRRVSEYKTQKIHRGSRKSWKRYRRNNSFPCSPRKKASGSRLVKLKPSTRYLRKTEERHVECEGRSSRYSPIFGIVSYEFWKRRRYDFLRRIYSLHTGRVKDPRNLVNVMFTCGVCYKSFETRVRLDQHSDELMHYACVRCGKFFTSNTALGQHRIGLAHYLY